MEQGNLFDMISMDSLLEEAEQAIRPVDFDDIPDDIDSFEESFVETIKEEPKKEKKQEVKKETKEEPKKEVEKEPVKEPVKEQKQEVKKETKEEPKKETKSNDEITVEEVKKQEKPKPKKKAARKTNATNAPKQEPETSVNDLRFNGVLKVTAYGEELFTVNDNTVSLEDIRDRLVNDYHFTEFKDKNTCTMVFDPETGVVKPHIEFMKKG